jgi:hypothetical protein
MPPAARRSLRMKSGRAERRARRNTARIDLLQNLRLRARFHQPTKLKSSATTTLTCPRAVLCLGACAIPSRAAAHAHSRLVRTVKAACPESKLPEIEAVTVYAQVWHNMPQV